MAYVQKDLDLSGAIAKENSNLIWRRKNSRFKSSVGMGCVSTLIVNLCEGKEECTHRLFRFMTTLTE